MSITSVRKDASALTMTTSADFSATAERVWRLWADPRQLERWWGPPSHPATVTSHDLRPGGRVAYRLTGAAGDEHRGYWDVLAVERPHSLAFRDGFTHADGSPNTDLPSTESHVSIVQVDERRTTMSIESVFASAEAMARLLRMGMEQGLTQAVGQIDAILAEDSARSAESTTDDDRRLASSDHAGHESSPKETA
ncbi:MAG: hypothetical protein QOF49_374 [Chloroflexota bacterium]|jgi:uncharacterized protein YndB with AHSA1/START domain|nr:hypothetical protein [Chloroflexota bacterium]